MKRWSVLAMVFLCAPLNVLWLVLDQDTYGKLGYVVLSTCVAIDMFRDLFRARHAKRANVT